MVSYVSQFERPSSRAAMDAWNVLLGFLGLSALFFLLTNGIPLIQWGWLEPLGSSKHVYVKLTRIALLSFSIPLFVCYKFFPDIFSKLGVVKAARAVLALPPLLVTTVLFIVYVGLTAWGGWVRHDALESRGFDLGIFAQAVWNTTQGDWLYSSIKGGINLMGDHVSPILVLIAPAYALWPDPKLLIALQAIAVGSCLFLIGALAQKELEDRFLIFVFLMMYFFNAPTRAALHEDFHPESLVEPFLYVAFIALEKSKLPLYLLMLVVIATAKEGMLLITLMFGVYTFLFKKRRFLGAAITLFSLAFFLWEVQWLVPLFNHGEPYHYGNIYANIFKVSKEGNLLQRISDPDSWEYLFKVFSPFAFLPFFDFPTLTLTFPVLFQNLFSTRDTMRSLNYHYNFGLLPFIFISAIYGFKKMSQMVLFRRFSPPFLGGILLLIHLLRSGPSEYYYLFQSGSNITAHTRMVARKLREIPSRYSVLTHNAFSAQLPNRKNLYHFDFVEPIPRQEVVNKLQVDYVAFDVRQWEVNPASIPVFLQQIQKFGYRIEFEKDGFYLIAKG